MFTHMHEISVCDVKSHDVILWFLEKKREPNYIPPAPSEDEEAIFLSMQRGINFDKYDEIPVECTGNGAPQRGISRLDLFK